MPTNPATPQSLGTRLRARRLALNLTLAQVAERSGLSLPYISNLERDRGNPTSKALSAVAEALEARVSDLLDSTPERRPDDVVLAQAPKSLTRFFRTERTSEVVAKLAKELDVDTDELRSRLLVGMSSAPRRSSGEPTEDDWRRLLDVYVTILRE